MKNIDTIIDELVEAWYIKRQDISQATEYVKLVHILAQLESNDNNRLEL